MTESAHDVHWRTAQPVIGCSACEAIDPGTWREHYTEVFIEMTGLDPVGGGPYAITKEELARKSADEEEDKPYIWGGGSDLDNPPEGAIIHLGTEYSCSGEWLPHDTTDRDPWRTGDYREVTCEECKRRVHFLAPPNDNGWAPYEGDTLCENTAAEVPMTEDIRKVTCIICRREVGDLYQDGKV